MERDEEGRENLVFRYSREERLKRAPESVRRLNDPAFRKRPSLLRTIVPNRASALLLLGILMLAATVIVMRMLMPAENAAEVAGNRFTLDAFRFQGGTYLALKKRVLADGAYAGPIEVSIIDDGGSAASATRQIVLKSLKEEEFRFSIDGERERVQVVVAIGERRGVLKAESQ